MIKKCVKKFYNDKRDELRSICKNSATEKQINKPVLITCIIIALLLAILIICNLIIKSLTMYKIIACIYLYSLCISFSAFMLIRISCRFDELNDTEFEIVNNIHFIALCILRLCIFPIILIEKILCMLIGVKTNIFESMLYYGLLIHFILIVSYFIIQILTVLNFNIIEKLDLFIIFFPLFSYIISLIWVYIYTHCCNFNFLDRDEVLKMNNCFMYALLFITFVINNTIFKNSKYEDNINVGITALTLFILFIDERKKIAKK